MRNYSPGITFALVIVLSYSPTASAQVNQQQAEPPKTSPEKALKSTTAKAQRSGPTPDFSGVWMLDHPPATALQYWVYEFNVEEPPMTAWGEEQFKASKSSFGAHPYPLEETNDPVYNGCSPPGLPRVFIHPFPIKIVQAPGEVLMLFEYDSLRREIYADGRPHDTNLGPSWMGDSIGRWEGETLVVDTLNFNDKTWIDRVGHTHTDALHLVERIRRINHNHLLDDITITDPKTYAKPWTAHLDFLLRPKWRLEEQFCEDGESFRSLERKETTPGK